jgi:hypothetical protein
LDATSEQLTSEARHTQHKPSCCYWIHSGITDRSNYDFDSKDD